MLTKDELHFLIHSLNLEEGPGSPCWEDLRQLVAGIEDRGADASDLEALFGVFERVPTTDNHELWGLMHFLESIQGYEVELFSSARRKPSIFTLRMLRRRANSGLSSDKRPLLLALESNEIQEIHEQAKELLVGWPHGQAEEPEKAKAKKTKAKKTNWGSRAKGTEPWAE